MHVYKSDRSNALKSCLYNCLEKQMKWPTRTVAELNYLSPLEDCRGSPYL